MTNLELIEKLKKEFPDTLEDVTVDNLVEKQTQIEMVRYIVLLLTPSNKKKG